MFTQADQKVNTIKSSYCRFDRDGLKLIVRLTFTSATAKVLDLNCGTGYLSSVLAQRLRPKGMVIAVGPDKESIKAARSHWKQRSVFRMLQQSHSSRLIRAVGSKIKVERPFSGCEAACMFAR